jgi:hypothetical protein
MYYVGFCRICGTGPLGVRACGRCGDLSILCDECDALWTNLNTQSAPVSSREESLPCPSCGGSLLDPSSHWARRGEIAATGWLQQAITEGRVTLQHGAPLVGE